MSDHPHGYNYGKTLRQIWPELTKNNLRIIIWTVVFMANAVLVLWAAQKLGFPVTASGFMHMFRDGGQYSAALFGFLKNLVLPFWLLIALIPFSIEAFVYTIIVNLTK